MREIKFRYWHEDDREMYFQTHGDLGAGSNNADGEPILEWSPFVIELPLKTSPDLKFTMQFTGLLDKNGKEIYEGDIVQFNMPLSPKPQIRQIIYSNKYAAFVVSTGDYFPQSDWELEIIGNIYENPELLTASGT